MHNDLKQICTILCDNVCLCVYLASSPVISSTSLQHLRKSQSHSYYLVNKRAQTLSFQKMKKLRMGNFICQYFVVNINSFGCWFGLFVAWPNVMNGTFSLMFIINYGGHISLSPSPSLTLPCYHLSAFGVVGFDLFLMKLRAKKVFSHFFLVYFSFFRLMLLLIKKFASVSFLSWLNKFSNKKKQMPIWWKKPISQLFFFFLIESVLLFGGFSCYFFSISSGWKL